MFSHWGLGSNCIRIFAHRIYTTTSLTLCVVIPDPFNTSMTWLFKKQFQLIRRLAHFHTIADNVVNASAEMQCPVCICMLCTHTLLPQREKCMQCTLGGCRQQPLSRDSRRQIAIARRCSLHFCLFFSKNLTQFRIHSCIPTKGWFRSTNLFWWLNRTECPFCSCSLPLWLRDKKQKNTIHRIRLWSSHGRSYRATCYATVYCIRYCALRM